MNDISFLAWFKISGPTFVLAIVGFGVLWHSQQVASARLDEMIQARRAQTELLRNARLHVDARFPSANLARGEDAFIGFDRALARLERSIARLDASIDRLGERIDRREPR